MTLYWRIITAVFRPFSSLLTKDAIIFCFELFIRNLIISISCQGQKMILSTKFKPKLLTFHFVILLVILIGHLYEYVCIYYKRFYVSYLKVKECLSHSYLKKWNLDFIFSHSSNEMMTLEIIHVGWKIKRLEWINFGLVQIFHRIKFNPIVCPAFRNWAF